MFVDAATPLPIFGQSSASSKVCFSLTHLFKVNRVGWRVLVIKSELSEACLACSLWASDETVVCVLLGYLVFPEISLVALLWELTAHPGTGPHLLRLHRSLDLKHFNFAFFSLGIFVLVKCISMDISTQGAGFYRAVSNGFVWVICVFPEAGEEADKPCLLKGNCVYQCKTKAGRKGREICLAE